MDLANIGTGNDASRLELIDPRSGKPLEHEGEVMYLTGYGVQSAKFAEATKATKERYIGMADESNDLTIEIYAESIADGKIFMDGKWLKPTTQNIFKLFKLYGWIYRQWVLYAANHANFLEELPEN